MPRENNKEQILEAGLQVLYEKGFNDSSVQEITNAGSVPKGSFYNYFKSKEDFSEQIIELYAAKMSDYLDQRLLQEEGSPLDKLKALFEGWILHYEKGNRSGCLVGNLSQELAIQNPKLQKALDRAFNQLQNKIIACLKEAQRAEEIDKNIDVEVLGGFIYNSWQGAMIRIKAQGNADALEQFQKVIFDNLLMRS